MASLTVSVVLSAQTKTDAVLFSGVGFYKWTKTVPANKAFLVIGDGGNVKELRFNFGIYAN